MDADPFVACLTVGNRLARRAKTCVRRLPLTASGIALLVAMQSHSAPAQSRPSEPPMLTKAAGAPAASRRAPTHEWIDRGVVRPLTLDSTLRADFSGDLAGKQVALRKSDVPLKDVSASFQSVVLRDESGLARALPGGVLVVLRADLEDNDARAILAGHGAPGARRVSGRLWLVESPAGLESLELANRLARTGSFDAAQPNWWVERSLK